MPDVIKRYIRLQRVSYEKRAYGLVFYFNEESYYRVCLYVDENQMFEIPLRNKKLLIRLLYSTRQKDARLESVEKHLKTLGFECKDTFVQTRSHPKEQISKFRNVEKFSRSMEKRGYHCIYPDFSRFREIENILIESDFIYDYQIDYKTDEEKRALQPGTYMCVVNRNNEICAASTMNISISSSSCYDGIVVVKEKYKMHGIAPFLANQRMKWLCDMNINNIYGQISIYNEQSLNYHKSLGVHFLDRYYDEFVLDKCNN